MSDVKMSKHCGAMVVVNAGDCYCGFKYNNEVFMCKDCKLAFRDKTIAKLQADNELLREALSGLVSVEHERAFQFADKALAATAKG